jgi:hypothetical protein
MAHFKKYMEGSGLDVCMDYLAEQQLVALQVSGTNSYSAFQPL